MTDAYGFPSFNSELPEVADALENATMAQMVLAAYSDQSMNSARSQQSRERLLGPSDLGGCRAKIAHTLTDAPRGERQKPPLAAFVGTWVGEGLERAYVASRPGSVRQVAVTVHLARLGSTNGTADVVDPDRGVIDFKTVDGLETVKRDGASFKHRAQIMLYLLGLIQMGELSEDSRWYLVYIDRSGKDTTPYVVSGTLDMDLIHEIEERVDEAKYAALWGEEAPKDEPLTMCAQFCEFFDHCRVDSIPQGLIDDPDQVSAVDMYLEGQALESQGRQMRAEAKQRLIGVEGSTTTAVVRWVEMGATRVEAFTRRASARLDIRKR